MVLILLFGVFFALMALGSPISFCFLISGVVYLLVTDQSLALASTVMSGQVVNYVLLAVPLYIFAGELMNNAGITQRIFDFANALTGHIRGGLGHVNVFASVIFSGISGSSAADAAGLGRIEIKAMREKGYRADFAAAITAASSTIGPIFPPSIALVLYGAIAEVGVDYLFLGGILPGLVMAGALMVAIYLQAVTGREHCPTDPWPGIGSVLRAFARAIPPLTAPVIIVGGILSGMFTPTEAGAAAVAFVVSLALIYGELRLRDIYSALLRSARATAMIMFILATSAVFAHALTVERAPELVAEAMFALSDDTNVLLALILVTLLILGLFESASANLLIATPILVPLAGALGIDLVHLGVVIVLALMIGVITPPVGVTLYIVSDIARIPVGRTIRATGPYVLALIVALVLVAYIPDIVLAIPEAYGYRPTTAGAVSGG